MGRTYYSKFIKQSEGNRLSKFIKDGRDHVDRGFVPLIEEVDNKSAKLKMIETTSVLNGSAATVSNITKPLKEAIRVPKVINKLTTGIHQPSTIKNKYQRLDAPITEEDYEERLLNGLRELKIFKSVHNDGVEKIDAPIREAPTNTFKRICVYSGDGSQETTKIENEKTKKVGLMMYL